MNFKMLFAGAMLAGGISVAYAGVTSQECQSVKVNPINGGKVSVECTAPNFAPVAIDDIVTVIVGQTATGNVLLNDSDADSDPLTVVQPNEVVGASGIFSIPTTQVGTVEYLYEATDGQDTDVAVLTIEVTNNLPVANPDAITVVAGTPAIGNVLDNDTDADGHTLTVTPNGVFEADGTFTIQTPLVGTFTYPYEVTDGYGVFQTGELTVTVTNDAPVVQNEEVIVTVGQTAQGNVLLNDSDPNGHALTVAQPNGFIAEDGSFAISTEGVGSDEFPYEVDDGFGGVVSGVLTVTATALPNAAPVANDDTGSGLSTTGASGNVLTNDTDPDGNALQIAGYNGDITIASDGSWTLPASAAGTYESTYTVTDGQLQDEGKLTVTLTDPPSGQTLAFPGADGAGRFAQGGRGGQVMFVTNLNDTGAGSLRACAEASGPRTCIFRVSGYINVASTIRVAEPYLTIAGETAPGQGVTLRSFGTQNCCDLMVIRTHDVIIRHMKYRGGHPPHNISGNGRNLLFGDIFGQNEVYNGIVANSSFSWATDQTFDVSPSSVGEGVPSPVSRITIQDSLVYEGLRPHSKGPNYRSCGVSTIRTLIASNTIRNPNNTCGLQDPNNVRDNGGITGENEFRNNMVYNGVDAFFDMWDGRGDAYVNIVGNVFKRGPNSKTKLNNNFAFNIYPVDAWNFQNRQNASGTCQQNGNAPNCNPTADALHIYLQDNIAQGFGTNPGGAPIQGVLNPNDAHLLSSTPVGDGVFEDGILGPIMPASQVQAYIMANAGAFPHNRDQADINILNDVQNGTGNVPSCNTAAVSVCTQPPYPLLAGGANYPDADNDGMDDNWEAANGVGDANADADGDGWTNLEEFLHFRASQV